jgi:hypothetical protein
MKYVLVLLSMVIAVALLSAQAIAEAPNLVNYQGILTDTGGTPLNGTFDLSFRIYADSSQAATDLWAERHSGVVVDDGLFNVILGSIAYMPDSLFAGGERWMGIQVGGDPEIYPRMQITSVPWAMRATVADSALSAPVASDGDWIIATDDMYSSVSGNVGVGTSSPLTDLHVEETDVSLPGAALYNDAVVVEDNDAGLGLYSSAGGNYGSALTLGEIDGGVLTNKWSMYRTTGTLPQLRFSCGTNASYASNDLVMTMKSNGYIGIGTSNPDRLLELYDIVDNVYLRMTSGNYQGSILEMKNNTAGESALGKIRFLNNTDYPEGSITFYSNPSLIPAGLYFYTNATARMVINRDTGNIGIGTSFPDEMLHVTGTVKAGILRLTSGADVAEPFDVGGAETIEAGMVVAIDSESPGKLKVCDDPYDRCVAGIVSGAGGLSPGMLMGQEGSPADGEYPVALTGRVYCWVDASGGPIKPGDLLTTSSTPGHAMKVTDYERAQGAVLGKAMSSLDEGRGLVLVLVTLQ